MLQWNPTSTCVRETSPQNSVVIVDMSMPMQPLRRPITADSALMNPNGRILALKESYCSAFLRPQLVKGNMQLFSVDQQRSQALEAHAASFAATVVPGNEDPSILICFASKSTNAGQVMSKLHVIELGSQPGKPAFTKKRADLFFPPDFSDDFPVAMQLNNLELAVHLARRGNLPGSENLVVQRFQELFSQAKYKEAAELAAESPKGILRTPDTVAKFQKVRTRTTQPQVELVIRRRKRTSHAAKINGHEDVPHNNEKALLKTLANQPISVAIDASGSAFQFYKGGVLKGECGIRLDHGVTVVGYGTNSNNGIKYWLVKNSWGTEWGDKDKNAT
ncbi:hypothetical protein IFM89_026612 [Coptis chinensis]|uniref:Peptidase C1A papain C-terminal domain-containing protein n=1 Tax=Coptis chinensis TaxID=261450 RepID=A0A835HHN1_9MAGN|nr:hypothetical protein IFM89_026612 [Coptis chinensis]